MNNIIIIGAILVIAAIVITVLSLKLHRKKKQISLDEAVDTVNSEVQQAQDKVIKQTSEMIKDLPPVDGPEAYKIDFDNPYSITNNEPLVIAEKCDIEDLCEKADNGKIAAAPIVIPNIDTPAPVVAPIPTFDNIVKEATPAVQKKRGRKKKETQKVEKKPAKKTEKPVKPIKATKVKTKKTTKKTKKETK